MYIITSKILDQLLDLLSFSINFFTIVVEHIIPIIGVWDKFEDIDFKRLPNQFVLKCTHDTGGLVICKDKEKINLKEVKKKINKSLKRNFYYYGREWPYKNVKPRIIIEKYMEDNIQKDLIDYKSFCYCHCSAS